ncbi:serine/threonine protein phosphatase [Erythrobacter litoralis]|uniref:metallophosphoesterase family protein n=1 Tax=Erythrobacter litoralis TaxID=39960 RepID=UPI002435F79A|nr:metallophosphoesterase family protein [Erythrobacter litoralis]MDG6078014.1 serine/threonine protein phosphatase [Erythrobacter litoralis]
MFQTLRRILTRNATEKRVAAVPDGERWYIVGDVHGRADLFAALTRAIEDDDRANTPTNTSVVLLGDLIDRGPDSATVVAHAREWGSQRTVRYLAGNHEEMFLESFDNIETLRHFLKHGGRETILSYGVSEADYTRMRLEELQAEIRQQVPQEDRDFLAAFEEYVAAGDYVFVHAGLNPAHSLEDQKRADMLWIRERFLRHEEPFSHVVVHGHTIFQDIETTPHRIGIDTGAFRTGRLTALVLEGEGRRRIQAVAQDDGTIEIEKGDIV